LIRTVPAKHRKAEADRDEARKQLPEEAEQRIKEQEQPNERTAILHSGEGNTPQLTFCSVHFISETMEKTPHFNSRSQ
jgi:hypothetical protein